MTLSQRLRRLLADYRWKARLCLYPLIAGLVGGRGNLFVLLLPPLLVACGGVGAPQSEPARPVMIALDYDVTASARNLPKLEADHLDQLISAAKKPGGVLAFGLIAERADEPLVRLELVPVNGRLGERARRALTNRKAIAQWKAQVEPKLSRQRDAPVTDFHGVLLKLDAFFRNPTIPANALKVAWLLTDGEHTARHNRLINPRLPADVTVIAVGMRRGLAERMFGKSVVLVEDVGSALKLIRSLSGFPSEE